MTANLFTKKIEITKSEAKEAGKLNSEKFKELREYMEAYPGYEILIKAPSKRKVEFKGLTYDYMKEYIQKHDDAQKSKMTAFETLIAQSKKNGVDGAEHLEAANYIEVREWFLNTFSDIKTKKEEHNKKVKEILSAAAESCKTSATQTTGSEQVEAQ